MFIVNQVDEVVNQYFPPELIRHQTKSDKIVVRSVRKLVVYHFNKEITNTHFGTQEKHGFFKLSIICFKKDDTLT